jgi:enoyl-CoA hydratase/carnithine racemase
METLNITNDGAIRIVELDRPEALNAFNSLLMDELADAFLDAGRDDSMKIVVLTGAGRAFSAGADLMDMGRAQAEPRHGFPGLLDAIIDFPKPFVVAVNGLGAGIGATICGLSDFTYMSSTARLRCPFSALGLTAEAASTYLFPLLLGRQNANWFLMSSQWIDAVKCKEMGLALDVFEAENFLESTLEQARVLANLPLASLCMTKKLMLDPIRDQIKASAKAENQGLAELVGGAANKEALRAFREKREPDFSNLT